MNGKEILFYVDLDEEEIAENDDDDVDEEVAYDNELIVFIEFRCWYFGV